MIQAITADEARVLGVLIEKAFTTPEQYPLSLNAVTNGANQKSNRDPVRAMSEDECFAALESLRTKALVVRVDVPGNRVQKYRHIAAETLHARGGELAMLAELLLRGPQTAGELRTRASRMAPMETLEAAIGYANALINREEPLAREIPPLPGSRANRYVQLLSPDLHAGSALAATTSAADSADAEPKTTVAPGSTLNERVNQLERDLADMREKLARLSAALGEDLSA